MKGQISPNKLQEGFPERFPGHALQKGSQIGGLPASSSNIGGFPGRVPERFPGKVPQVPGKDHNHNKSATVPSGTAGVN